MKKHLSIASLLATAIGLTACGGGGGGGGGSSESPPAASPSPTATAQLVAPADAKTEWNKSTPVEVTLKDGSGKLIDNPSCTSTDPVGLTAAVDCKSIIGNRFAHPALFQRAHLAHAVRHRHGLS